MCCILTLLLLHNYREIKSENGFFLFVSCFFASQPSAFPRKKLLPDNVLLCIGRVVIVLGGFGCIRFIGIGWPEEWVVLCFFCGEPKWPKSIRLVSKDELPKKFSTVSSVLALGSEAFSASLTWLPFARGKKLDSRCETESSVWMPIAYNFPGDCTCANFGPLEPSQYDEVLLLSSARPGAEAKKEPLSKSLWSIRSQKATSDNTLDWNKYIFQQIRAFSLWRWIHWTWIDGYRWRYSYDLIIYSLLVTTVPCTQDTSTIWYLQIMNMNFYLGKRFLIQHIQLFS